MNNEVGSTTAAPNSQLQPPAQPQTQLQPRDTNTSLLTIVKAQIVFLLSTLTEDNFERNQNEIRLLSDQHGIETYLHFLRRLISATQSRVLAVNTAAVWETSTLLTFRLLVNETQRIARDPFLADRFREAIDKAETEPFRHFDLVRFVDRIGLRPLERVVLTSSILSATNRRDLVQQAASIIRLDFETARAALMNHPAFDSGDLTPAQVAKFVSNLLCDPPPDAPILDPAQRANLLTTISAKYGNEVVTSILKQVLPRIGLLPNTTLPQVLVQLGHELTTDPEVIRALLQRFGLTDANPPKDMQVLEVISRMARYAVEGHQLCDIGALIRALASYNTPIHWDKAVRVLDQPQRAGIDTATLKLIVAILSNAPENSEHHAVTGFWQTWSNALYQLRLVDALLSLPADTFSFVHLPGRRVVTVDDVATASPTIKSLAANVQSSTWNSLDLFELLVRLDDHESPEVKSFVREMLDRAVRVSAELVHMGLLQVPKPWNTVQREYANKLLGMFLAGHPNHQLVFMRIWQIDPDYLLTAFRDHYNENPINITRILDVAQDLKILDSLLEVQPFAFSLDVAALASRREYLNLDKWLSDNTAQHGEAFIREMVEFLRVKVSHEQSRMHDMTAESRMMLLNAQTVAIFIRAMRNFVGSAAGVNLTNEDTDQMFEVRNICLQAHPRLMNLIPGNEQEPGLSVVVYPPEVDAEVEDIYRQLYAGKLTVEALLDVLQEAKASNSARDPEIFAGVLHTVFDEYKFYPQYPPRELMITANLFGSLIQYHLVDNIPLGIAVRYVIAAMAEPYGSTLYRFGVQALGRFYPRLVEFPSVCQQLLVVPHFVEHEPELAENVRRALRLAESGSGGERMQLSVFTTIMPDELDAEEGGIVEPEEEVSDKILFIVNNLAPSNFDAKVDEMKDRYSDKYARWFARYLVEERVSTEPNNHGLYIRFLDSLNRPYLMRFILHETYVKSAHLINDDATLVNQQDRVTLKNLATWLGSITLAHDKPIKHRNLSIKDLLIEGYDHQRLLVVIPFACKVLEAAARSTVFRPPNPWVMAIFGLLVEMFHCAELKIQLKFEIELLLKAFGLERADVEEAHILRNRPQEVAAGELIVPEGVGVSGSAEREAYVETPTGVPTHAMDSPEMQSYIEGLLIEMRKRLHFEQEMDPWVNLQHFLRLVYDVFESTTRDVIPPVVERSASVAAISAQSLVSRDYALEPDEHTLQRAAHLMARKLATGLALVTAKDVLRTTLVGNLRAELERPGGSDLMFPDHYILKLVETNLDLTCLVVENVAVKRALLEVDKALESEYEIRRIHRQLRPNQPFWNPKNPVPEFASALPAPLRIHPNGVTPEQNQIYEDFNRPQELRAKRTVHKPGPAYRTMEPQAVPQALRPDRFQAPTPPTDRRLVAASLAPPIQERQIQPSISQKLGFGSACDKIDGCFLEFESFWNRQRDSADMGWPTMDDLFEQIHHINVSAEEPDRVQLYVCQKLVQALLSTKHEGPRQVYADILRFLSTHQSVKTAADAIDWFVHGEDARKYNIPAVLALVNTGSIDLDAYESELAQRVEAGDQHVIHYAVKLIRTCLLRENPIVPRENFIRCFEAMKVLELQGKASEDVIGLLEQLSVEVHTIATSNARLPQNFHNLYPKLEQLFVHWVQFYQGTTGDRDFLVYAVELESARVLKNDDTCAMFFRVCIEVSVNRYINVVKRGSTINPYLHVDALSRLLVLMIKYNGEESNDAAKAHILKKILSIITLVLSHQHEEFGQIFQQKPFFRFFSSLLSDLQSFESSFQTAYYPMMMNVCETLQALQPIYFPGFVFSWMSLISHRLFLPQMLITPNGEGWPAFHRLLLALLNFAAPFFKVSTMPKAARGLQQGVLRILLLLLHDFPEFLSAYYFSICEAIPTSCVQIRNVVLSAFPGTILLPDPHPSTLNEMFQDASVTPVINSEYRALLQAADLQALDQQLLGRGNGGIMSAIADRLVHDSNEAGERYNMPVLNALILYTGTSTAAQVAARNDTAPFSPNDPGVALIQYLATTFDFEGRHHLVSAIALNLRYPSQHTFWFSAMLIHLFTSIKDDSFKEVTIKVLLERVLSHRPHPWGIIMTIIELLRDPRCDLMYSKFMTTFPEISAILRKVNSHVNGSTSRSSVH